MSVLISTSNLTKRFGAILAVNDISFEVARGELLGFLGPNGAGKSTTMKMITGFITPTSGTATVCGYDVQREPVAAKRTMGYLPEGAPAYPDMTPASFLDFVGGIRGYDGGERRTRIDLAVQRCDLGRVLHQPIDTLSKGFKRRVGLAQALLHEPEVLILDEPTDGLDPNQKHEVRTLIRDLARDKAIIISTHILEEVDALCSRALIIAQGRIVADGTPAMLEARSRYHLAVSIVAKSDRIEQLAAGLGQLPCAASVERTKGADGTGEIIVFPRGGKPILDEVSRYLRDRALPVDEIRVERGRLDEVFRATTTGRT